MYDGTASREGIRSGPRGSASQQSIQVKALPNPPYTSPNLPVRNGTGEGGPVHDTMYPGKARRGSPVDVYLIQGQRLP